jgi:NADH dehydrogenase
VTQVKRDSILTGDFRLSSKVTLWLAGVEASRLEKCCPGNIDLGGALIVNEFLNPGRYRDVFSCGDPAHFEQDGMRIPRVAQPAIQIGTSCCRDMIAKDAPGNPRTAFPYFDKGI